MSENGTVKLEDAATLKTVVVGKGSFMKAIALGTGKLLCVWEDNDVIREKTI